MNICSYTSSLDVQYVHRSEFGYAHMVTGLTFPSLSPGMHTKIVYYVFLLIIGGEDMEPAMFDCQILFQAFPNAFLDGPWISFG